MAPTIEEAWIEALALSERGQIHAAVFQFESVHSDLEQQLEAAGSIAAASRVRTLLRDLLAKLDAEIEAHLAYLRGNLYAALDLSSTASADDVKKAFRRLALLYHPDKSRVSPKLFTIVKHAYETLSRPHAYVPDKSAQEWTLWRRQHAARFRDEVREYSASESGSELRSPTGRVDVGDVKSLTADAVRGMRVGELKTWLRHLGVPLRGHLERSDLESELLRFTSDRGADHAPSEDIDLPTLAAELPALGAVDRRRRAAALSSDQLRDLLRLAGQAPPSFFGHSTLATAVVHAYAHVLPTCADGGAAPLKESRDKAETRDKNTAKEDNPSPVKDEARSTHCDGEPVREPAPPPESNNEEVEECETQQAGAQNKKDGFVNQLRARTSTAKSTAETTLPSEAEFWRACSKAAAASPLFDGEQFDRRHFFPEQQAATMPAPLAAGGAWFWGCE